MRRIQVTGSGTAEFAPDRARIVFSITTYKKDMLAAKQQTVHRLQLLNHLLDKMHIDDQDRRTNRFNIQPDYHRSEKEEKVILRGYSVSTSLTVTVRNLEVLGELLDRASDLGVGIDWNLHFYLEDKRPPQAEARRRAVAEARSRAEVLSSELGAALGNVLTIRETDGYNPGLFLSESSTRGRDFVASSLPVHAGTGEVSVEISVEWKLMSTATGL